jgi:hypothetical protein
MITQMLASPAGFAVVGSGAPSHRSVLNPVHRAFGDERIAITARRPIVRIASDVAGRQIVRR